MQFLHYEDILLLDILLEEIMYHWSMDKPLLIKIIEWADVNKLFNFAVLLESPQISHKTHYFFSTLSVE